MLWRRKDLVQWIFDEFRVLLEETNAGRELRALEFRKISAGPRHTGQNGLTVEDINELPVEVAEIQRGLPARTLIKSGDRMKPVLVRRPN